MGLWPLLCTLAVAPPGPAAPPLAEQYLHSGDLARGETVCLAALAAAPTNDEIRFGLGVIQFARGVENLGRALHEYGARSENATVPFLRLPVPENKNPSTISYRALGRVLDAFAQDLGRAEATLAGIKDDKVQLRLRLAEVTFDFAGDAKNKTTLSHILNTLNRGRLDLFKANKEFRVHFDRGDVAWLRAYCHLLSAMVEGYRAVNEEVGFEARVQSIFPKVEKTKPHEGEWHNGLNVTDPPRLRRARLHLVAVCELNRETWKHILAETDDDFEWLPNPKQKGVLGLPVRKEMIDAWLACLAHLEEVLNGDRLIGSNMLRLVTQKTPRGDGLNLRKLFDDPPADLFNLDRVREDGIAAKFLEPEGDRKLFDFTLFLESIPLFQGPFGFAYAAWFN